jgi:hypothetical protein
MYLVVISYVLISTLYLSYELPSFPSIPTFRSGQHIKLYNHSLNTINSKNNNDVQVPVVPPRAQVAASAIAAREAVSTSALQLAVIVSLQPPVTYIQALYGNIQARRRDRYEGHVSPDMLAISVQQSITHWETIVDFVFESDRDSYMRPIALCSTHQRALALNDNVLFFMTQTMNSLPTIRSRRFAISRTFGIG